MVWCSVQRVTYVPVELILKPEFSHERSNCESFCSCNRTPQLIISVIQKNRKLLLKEKYFIDFGLCLNRREQVMHCCLTIIIIITCSRYVHIPFCFILSFSDHRHCYAISTLLMAFLLFENMTKESQFTHKHTRIHWGNTYKMHKQFVVIRVQFPQPRFPTAYFWYLLANGVVFFPV